MAEAWEQWHGEIVNGEFRLCQFLGGSDHSAVFMAERTAGGAQRLALKFVPANQSTLRDDLARWEHARKLNHPNLLPIVASGHCMLGNTPFLYVVTELADENLGQVIPQRPLTPRETRDMLRPVLDALGYLHKQGLAHGHIAPSNLMAVGDRIKLSSDTLSVAADARNGERVQFPADDLPASTKAGVSRAADVWSLGATLVEVLTQRRTAWEETVHGEPLFREKLPDPFREIAKRCLHRDPARRPSVEEIARLLDSQPANGKKPAGAKEIAGEKAEAGSRRGLYIAAAMAVVVIAIIGWTRFGSRNGSVTPPTTPAEATRSQSREVRESEGQQPGARQPEAPARPASQTAKSEAQKRGPAKNALPAPKMPPAASIATPTAASAKQPERAREPSAANAAGGGSVIHQALPNVPQSARNTVTGRVRVVVRVLVDASGSVTDVSLDSPGPSKYFARLASEAARDWKFQPPQVNGTDVPSEWLLRFGFGREDTVVSASQVKP